MTLTTQKYGLLAAVTALAVIIMSLGALSFAQTVTPVTCTVASSSVGTNQSVILTAAGGDGSSYSFSGPNITTTNGSSTQFAVSYPNAGTYTIYVTSGGQTGSCNVNVVTNTTSTGTLMCAPAVQSVYLGQTASVGATGGDGTYMWSSPDLTISNATGSGFSANFASTGAHTLTVSSAGMTSTCAINVLPNTTTTPPVTTPGLPDTGGGYGK